MAFDGCPENGATIIADQCLSKTDASAGVRCCGEWNDEFVCESVCKFDNELGVLPGSRTSM